MVQILYFMTAYRDEDHYGTFVSAMKQNEKYQEMSKMLASDREAIEVAKPVPVR